MSVTVGDFVKQLEKIAAADPDALLRINGEYVDQLVISLQHPIATVATNERPYLELEHDKTRRRVVDVSANGREAESLPEAHYDRRHW